MPDTWQCRSLVSGSRAQPAARGASSCRRSRQTLAVGRRVCVRDDVLRLLNIEECWNSLGNINASVRSTRRKIAEAAQLAVALGGEGGAYRVHACWIVRDTRRNREIVARYPDLFATVFPGSSRQWVRAPSLGRASRRRPSLGSSGATCARLRPLPGGARRTSTPRAAASGPPAARARTLSTASRRRSRAASRARARPSSGSRPWHRR